MRRSLFLVLPLITLLAAQSASSQNFWQKANESAHFTSFWNGRSEEIYGLNSRLYQSFDQGSNWILFDSLSGEHSFAIDSNGVMYVGTATKLMRSLDTGVSWTDLSFRGCTSLEIHDGSLYAAADSGLYRTSDQGLNWTHLYTSSVPITLIAFSSNGDIFLRQGGSLMRAHNGSPTFSEVYRTNYTITGIAFIPPRDIYLSIAKDVGGNLDHSTNGGDSFDAAGLGFGSTPMNGIVVGDSNRLYVLGAVQDQQDQTKFTDGYAFVWKDAITPISDISSGLPHTDARVLALAPHGRLIASTDSGIYRSQRSVVEVPQLLTAGAVLSVYPNPFRSSTMLRLALDRPTHTQIIIYDMLGRVVARPFDGLLTSGEHEIPVGGFQTSSGHYFCRVRTTSSEATLMINRLQ